MDTLARSEVTLDQKEDTIKMFVTIMGSIAFSLGLLIGFLLISKEK